MPNPTDNHQFDVGHEIGDDWDYDQEFQHIEERLVVRDTEANLGNYTPHAEATFIATDTGAVYDGDGANWIPASRELESVTAEQATVSTDVVRAYGSGDYYEDFKISNYADIGAAINAAIEKTPTEGGGVQLPAGEYTQTTQIDGGARGLGKLSIVGHGVYGTNIVLANGMNMDQIRYIPSSGNAFALSLCDFSLDGNKANNTSGRCVTLGNSTNSVKDLLLRRMYLHHASDAGIKTTTQWGYKFEFSIIEQCGNHGFYMTGTASAVENGVYVGSRFGANDGNNCFINGANDTMIFGCEFDSSTNGHGLKLNGCAAGRVIACTAASNGLSGYQDDGGSQNQFGYCQANANSGSGIDVLSDAADTRIDSPAIRNDDISDAGTRTRINGVGTESAIAETPTAADWDTGDTVDFTDSGDGTGNGVYQLMPDGTWAQLA